MSEEKTGDKIVVDVVVVVVVRNVAKTNLNELDYRSAAIVLLQLSLEATKSCVVGPEITRGVINCQSSTRHESRFK